MDSHTALDVDTGIDKDRGTQTDKHTGTPHKDTNTFRGTNRQGHIYRVQYRLRHMHTDRDYKGHTKETIYIRLYVLH